MRNPLIAGNWKMNMSIAAGQQLASRVAELPGSNAEVAVIPPATHLSTVAEALRGSRVKLGAQNCHWESAGAYTGEVSPEVLHELGVQYVLIGHSERRSIFHEDHAMLGKKFVACQQQGLTPLLCVGETLEERQAGKEKDVVRAQLHDVLTVADATPKMLLAYEPVWAIGTGQVATAEQAQEMHAFIRTCVAEWLGDAVANDCRILYGGSMKPNNAENLLSRPDVDGGLIGGASLNPEDFAAIIQAANAVPVR